jgi:hypothetical protein
MRVDGSCQSPRLAASLNFEPGRLGGGKILSRDRTCHYPHHCRRQGATSQRLVTFGLLKVLAEKSDHPIPRQLRCFGVIAWR